MPRSSGAEASSHRAGRTQLEGGAVTAEAGTARSELVVEPRSCDALTLLCGDLDVGGRQQVDAVGDQLDLPVEPVDQSAREIDQAPRDRVLRGLQVHDDRRAV